MGNASDTGFGEIKEQVAALSKEPEEPDTFELTPEELEEVVNEAVEAAATT